MNTLEFVPGHGNVMQSAASCEEGMMEVNNNQQFEISDTAQHYVCRAGSLRVRRRARDR